MSSYRTGIGFNVGPMTLIADLQTVVPSTKKTNLKLVCPTHKSFVHQIYECDEENHAVTYQEALRGVPTADGLRVVPQEKIPEVEKSESLSFVGVPLESLEANTIPTGKMYYVSPSKKGGSGDMWNVMHELASSEETGLVTQGALRKGRATIFRLTLFQGYLTIQALAFPDTIREAPVAPDSMEDDSTVHQWVDAAQAFAAATAVSWNDFDTEDVYEKNLLGMLEVGELVKQSESDTDTSAAAQIAELQALVKELEAK